MRLRLALLALLSAGCDSPVEVMGDAAVPPDALVCDASTRFCVDTNGTPSVGATVTAEASGEDTITGTTESNGCVILDLPHRAWNISSRTIANCTSAPTFTNVTGCAFVTVPLHADTCP